MVVLRMYGLFGYWCWLMSAEYLKSVPLRILHQCREVSYMAKFIYASHVYIPMYNHIIIYVCCIRSNHKESNYSEAFIFSIIIVLIKSFTICFSCSQLSTPWDLLRLDWSMLRDYCCRGGAEPRNKQMWVWYYITIWWLLLKNLVKQSNTLYI